MFTRRVCSLLCTVICTGLLLVGLGTQSGTAQPNKERALLPVADGAIIDNSPFDGVPDGVVDDAFNTVSFNAGLQEGQAAIEFDLGRISPNRIQSATLKIVSAGTGAIPGILTIPVEVRGYLGDGSITTDDFNAGTVLTTFDSRATPDHTPILIDVTEFVSAKQTGKSRIVGFGLRTDVHGVQINYGSLELGTAPTLVITLK